jgi:hypothetical protein
MSRAIIVIVYVVAGVFRLVLTVRLVPVPLQVEQMGWL